MSRKYTADPHFGHANVIMYCGRPVLKEDDLVLNKRRQGGLWWKSPDIAQERSREMDQLMTDNWNKDVNPGDDVYVLGDFCFGSKAAEYAAGLNGNIHLILGNHDYKYNYRYTQDSPFESINDTLNLQMSARQSIFLSHYGHRVWPRSNKGAYHLYGHSHTGLPDWGLSFDCGMDGHDYHVWSEEQILEKFAKLRQAPDHLMQHHP